MMIDLYRIEDTECLHERELAGEEYCDPSYWPTFQEDYQRLQVLLQAHVELGMPAVILRIFDGEFLFLDGRSAGNIPRRHLSRPIDRVDRGRFREGFLKADFVATQLYRHEMSRYQRLFPERPVDFPMELIYGLVANRWILRRFRNRIGLIGGRGKIALIRELMSHREYRDYLGIDRFTDYVEVPERFCCDDVEGLEDLIGKQLERATGSLFLFGIGISKLAVAHTFKHYRPAVYLDIGCGMSALAGTVGIDRPYFGLWTNFRIWGYDYEKIDPTDYYPSANDRWLEDDVDRGRAKGRSIIVDPLSHAPHLKGVIRNSLYLTRFKHHDYPSGSYTETAFKANFGFDPGEDEAVIEDFLRTQTRVKALFIVFPVLSSVLEHQGPKSEAWRNLFSSLYKTFSNLPRESLVIVDNHPYDYDPTPYLKRLSFSHDLVLKRVYSPGKSYSSCVIPYPFVMCTVNDPFYPLLNRPMVMGRGKKNRLFWCGSLFEHREQWGEIDVVVDRREIHEAVTSKHPEILETRSQVPYDQFVETISQYRFALDLTGCSRLNKRFYEILMTDTLVLAQAIGVEWPFERGDGFSEECFFTDADDLYEKFSRLSRDDKLYDRCLANQIYLVGKYFNKEWIGRYIESARRSKDIKGLRGIK
jgi:hypothetical protein